MSKDAAPIDAMPAVAGLRRPANALDPRVRGLWTLYALGAAAAGTLVSGAILVAIRGAREGGLPLAVWIAWGAAAALALVVAGVAPGMVYPHHRWEVTALGLYVQKGWLWRSWTIVPHDRIQAVDTTAGLVERRYGLATVHVRTASAKGSGEVPGLSAVLADRLTRELARHAGEGEAA